MRSRCRTVNRRIDALIDPRLCHCPAFIRQFIAIEQTIKGLQLLPQFLCLTQQLGRPTRMIFDSIDQSLHIAEPVCQTTIQKLCLIGHKPHLL